MEKHTIDSMKVAAGESVSRSVSVDEPGKKVIRHHVTKHDTAGNMKLSWTFDFSGVNQGQLLELASRSVVIGARGTFKKCPVSDIPSWADRTIDVAAWLASERDTLSPVERVKKIAESLDKDTLEALLKELANKAS